MSFNNVPLDGIPMLSKNSFVQHSSIILNFILFNVGWFICIYWGGLPALAFALLFIAVHHFFLFKLSSHLSFIVIVSSVGFGFDMFLQTIGFISFRFDTLGPLWLLNAWILFTITLLCSLTWLNRLPLILRCAIGGISGPLSYWAGIQLGAGTLHVSVLIFLVVYGLWWALLLPTALILFQRGIFRKNH